MRGVALALVLLLMSMPVVSAVSVRLVRTIPSEIDKQVAKKDFLVTLEFGVDGEGEEVVKNMFKCPRMSSISGVPFMFDDTSLHPTVQFISRPVNKVVIDCTFFVVVKNQTRAMNFSINQEIPITDNPMGQIDDASWEKIEGVEKKINDIGHRMKSLQKMVAIFGTWCTISKMLGTVNVMLQNLKLVLAGLFISQETACKAAFPFSVACLPPIAAAWTGVCSAQTAFHDVVNRFIWPVGFFGGGNIIGLINKWGCSIFFDCLLANVDQIASIGIEGLHKIDAVKKFTGKITSRFTKPAKPSRLLVKDEKGKYHIVSPGDKDSDKLLSQMEQQNNKELAEAKEEFETKPNDRLKYRIRRLEQQRRQIERMRTQFQIEANTRPTGRFATAITGLQTRGREKDPEHEEGQLPFTPQDAPKLEGEPTVMESITGVNILFDPYSSIHYASVTMCLPAILFNYKKDKQINCLYRNCLKSQAKAGLSLASCDKAYQLRECLYVESAQFKQSGYKVNKLLQKVGIAILKSYVLYISGELWQASCGNSQLPACKTPPGGVAVLSPIPTKCGVLGALFLTLEVLRSSKSKFGFGQYQPDRLGEKDFCADDTTVLTEGGGFFIPVRGLFV